VTQAHQRTSCGNTETAHVIPGQVQTCPQHDRHRPSYSQLNSNKFAHKGRQRCLLAARHEGSSMLQQSQSSTRHGEPAEVHPNTLACAWHMLHRHRQPSDHQSKQVLQSGSHARTHARTHTRTHAHTHTHTHTHTLQQAMHICRDMPTAAHPNFMSTATKSCC